MYNEPNQGRPRIVSAHLNGMLLVLDGQTGELVRSIEIEGNRRITALSGYQYEDGTGPARQRLVVAALDGSIRVFDAEEGELLRVLQEGQRNCVAYVYHCSTLGASGRPCLVVVKHWGMARVWDAEDGRLVISCKDDSGWLSSACMYAEQEGRIAIAGHEDEHPVIRIWDVETGEFISTLTRTCTENAEESYDCMCGYPTAEGPWRLVSGSKKKGTITVWDTETETGEILPRSGNGIVKCLQAFESNGRYRLACLVSDEVEVWDLPGTPPLPAVVRAANKTG